MSNQNQERKQFTEISLIDAVNSKGNSYTAVVLPKIHVNAEKVTQRDAGGHKVVEFRIPINNRAKMIGEKCGKTPKETDDGTSFAKVTLWDENGDRFLSFIGKHPRSIMSFVGSIKVSEDEGKDGNTYVNVTISASQWTFQRDVKSTGSEDGASASDNYGSTGSLPDGFQDIDDDDCPF